LLTFFFLSAAPLQAGTDPLPSDRIIGLSLMGIPKAYPLAVFSQAPVVNDRIGHLDIIVFYEGQKDYASAFFRIVGGEPLEFSGQARGMEADDLTSATWWDMTSGEAVAGNLVGMKLIPIPVSKILFSDWRALYPGSAIYRAE